MVQHKQCWTRHQNSDWSGWVCGLHGYWSMRFNQIRLCPVPMRLLTSSALWQTVTVMCDHNWHQLWIKHNFLIQALNKLELFYIFPIMCDSWWQKKGHHFISTTVEILEMFTMQTFHPYEHTESDIIAELAVNSSSEIWDGGDILESR